MADKIQAIRGMHDILPDQTPKWQYVERTLHGVMAEYGYQEIRLPIVEKTDLFKRSIGEVTDIVEKEMYTFEDRNGDSLTLRPEGTAGCLRACLEHGLLHNQTQRLWYTGPMFRHERPQKGRYRQFHQVGVEAYGMPGPDIDVELILLCRRLWRALGIEQKLELQINSLGTTEERVEYRAKLVDYLRKHHEALDEDSKRRLETNPLRILDSKNPALKEIIQAAPVLTDQLNAASKRHFEYLCQILDEASVPYTINPRLVRGLDYYSRTVFEWVTEELGAQGTVCAGGRYDGLVDQLGGKDSTAVGFALGMERLIELVEANQWNREEPQNAIFLIAVGEDAQRVAHGLAEKLRDATDQLKLQVNCGGGSFKTQFKRADKSGAKYALILGDDEVRDSTISLKPLRTTDQQVTYSHEQIIHFLNNLN